MAAIQATHPERIHAPHSSATKMAARSAGRIPVNARRMVRSKRQSPCPGDTARSGPKTKHSLRRVCSRLQQGRFHPDGTVFETVGADSARGSCSGLQPAACRLGPHHDFRKRGGCLRRVGSVGLARAAGRAQHTARHTALSRAALRLRSCAANAAQTQACTVQRCRHDVPA